MENVSARDFVELLTALASLLAAVLSYFNHKRLAAVDTKVEAVHIATNSLQDKLVVATAAAAKAEGVEIGRGQATAVREPPLTPP